MRFVLRSCPEVRDDEFVAVRSISEDTPITPIIC